MSIYVYQSLAKLGLPEHCIISMMPRVVHASFEAGAVLWEKGTSQPPFMLISSGLISANLPDKNGGIYPLNVFGSRSWIGEETLVNPQFSALDYVCLAPTRVLSIPYIDAQNNYARHVRFSNFVGQLTAWRNQRCAEMLMLMKTGSPALRVTMGLALLSESLRWKASPMPDFSDTFNYEIPLKQSYLAALFGVSRGVISLHLQQLAASNVLELHYAKVVLQSIPSWDHFIEHYRRNRFNDVKPNMGTLISLLKEPPAREAQAA